MARSVALSLWVVACSDSTGPTSGVVAITVTTYGQDMDPDGYTGSVDGGARFGLPVNGSVSIPDIAPGRHTLTIDGLDGNCTLRVSSRLEFTMPNDGSARVPVQVDCVLINALVFARDSSVYVTTIEPGAIPALLAPDFLGPSWSPDGRHLALVATSSPNFPGLPPTQALYLADPGGSDLRQVTDFGYLIMGTQAPWVVWSPDGGTLLFVRSRLYMPSFSGIWRVDVSGGEEKLFVQWVEPPAERFFMSSPTWSPDGSRVAFTLGATVYVANADGTTPTALASGYRPSWSPRSDDIAFSASASGDIHLIRADGTNDRELHVSGTPWGWSPDGTKLAITSSELAGDLMSVWVVNASGTARQRIGSPSYFISQAAWSYDGAHLAFISYSKEDDLVAKRGTISVATSDGIELHSVGQVGDICCLSWRP